MTDPLTIQPTDDDPSPLFFTVGQYMTHRETDNHRWTPLYAVVVVLWAGLFQKYWKRTRAEW